MCNTLDSEFPTGTIQFFDNKTNKFLLIVPLKNHDGEICNFFKIAMEHWDLIRNKNFICQKVQNGTYVQVQWREDQISKMVLLSHIIMGKPKLGHVIDHIDNDPLNYDFENLREISTSGNNRNRKKKQGLSSPYPNISWNPNNKKWVLHLVSKEPYLYLSHYYKDISWALWDRHLFMQEYPKIFEGSPTIPATEPPGFVRYKIKFRISKKHLKKRAKKRRLKRKAEVDKMETTRNKDGLAVIRTQSGDEFIVDEDKWRDLMMHSWHSFKHDDRIDAAGYVNGEKVLMARHLLGLKLNDQIEADHINQNTLDNRLRNLRKITIENRGIQNHNKRRRPNDKATSIYRNITKSQKGWLATVTKHGRVYRKETKTEYEALRVRDALSVALYGQYAKTYLPKEEHANLSEKVLKRMKANGHFVHPEESMIDVIESKDIVEDEEKIESSSKRIKVDTQ